MVYRNARYVAAGVYPSSCPGTKVKKPVELYKLDYYCQCEEMSSLSKHFLEDIQKALYNEYVEK